MLRTIAVVVALTSCTAAQSRHAHRAGEVTAAAGLIAMLGTIVVAEAFPDQDQQIYMAGRACIPFTVFGALLYAATDRVPPR